jgi:hypothetical protein
MDSRNELHFVSFYPPLEYKVYYPIIYLSNKTLDSRNDHGSILLHYSFILYLLLEKFSVEHSINWSLGGFSILSRMPGSSFCAICFWIASASAP